MIKQLKLPEHLDDGLDRCKKRVVEAQFAHMPLSGREISRQQCLHGSARVDRPRHHAALLQVERDRHRLLVDLLAHQLAAPNQAAA